MFSDFIAHYIQLIFSAAVIFSRKAIFPRRGRQKCNFTLRFNRYGFHHYMCYKSYVIGHEDITISISILLLQLIGAD